MSSPGYIPGLPGVRAAKTAVHKRVFRGGYVPDILPQGRLVNGTKSRDTSNSVDVTVLQPGLLMGIVSASADYAPSILGVTTGAVVGGTTTTITAAAAVVTELVRRIGSTGTFKLTGPPTAGGITVTETVTYSAASSTNITVTAPTNNFISGSFIQPSDGSETPITFIPDGYGIPVAEFDGTVLAQVQFPELPVTGVVEESQLIFWPSDSSLRRWIVARLNDYNGGQFIFNFRY